MKFTVEITKEELNAGAEYLDAIGTMVSTMTDIKPYSLVDKIKLMFGMEVTRKEGYIEYTVSNSKVIVIIDVPEDIVVDIMEIYRDITMDFVPSITMFIMAVKMINTKYEKRIEGLSNKIAESLVKEGV